MPARSWPRSFKWWNCRSSSKSLTRSRTRCKPISHASRNRRSKPAGVNRPVYTGRSPFCSWLLCLRRRCGGNALRGSDLLDGRLRARCHCPFDLVFQAVHAFLELDDALAQVTAHLGQPAAEDHDADDGQEQKMYGTQRAHGSLLKLKGCRSTLAGAEPSSRSEITQRGRWLGRYLAV